MFDLCGTATCAFIVIVGIFWACLKLATEPLGHDRGEILEIG